MYQIADPNLLNTLQFVNTCVSGGVSSVSTAGQDGRFIQHNRTGGGVVFSICMYEWR